MAAETLAVIIPCLNEGASIGDLVRVVRESGCLCVVADGGSTDDGPEQAARAGALVITAPRGRARQMNAGASQALLAQPGLQTLLFLHADSVLPADWLAQCGRCPAQAWARFDVNLHSDRLRGWRLGLLHTIGWFMNERSALTGICTGDQAMVIGLAAWQHVEGFPVLPLMEDIEISRRLKRVAAHPIRLPGPIGVSARRWEQAGVVRTMLHMWQLRLRWFFGESPDSIAPRYYPDRTHS